MEKYQFAFHSEIIGYTSPHIGEAGESSTQKSGKGKVCRHKELILSCTCTRCMTATTP